MIPITEKQRLILEAIPPKPGIRYGEIMNKTAMSNGYLIGSLQGLVDKGLVGKGIRRVEKWKDLSRIH